MTLRWDAPDAATLRRILADPSRLRGGIAASLGQPRSTHFRDVYFDTAAGELRQRGGRCRLRFTADGGRRLTVWQPDAQRIDERVRNVDDLAALAGKTEGARGGGGPGGPQIGRGAGWGRGGNLGGGGSFKKKKKKQ